MAVLVVEFPFVPSCFQDDLKIKNNKDYAKKLAGEMKQKKNNKRTD